MSRKPLLVGEAPGRNGSERCHPLFPRPAESAGGRLWRMSPLYGSGSVSDMMAYVDATVRVNLVPEYPGEDGWPVDLARAQALNLVRGGVFYERDVVLVGRRVADAVLGVVYPSLTRTERLAGDPCGLVFDGVRTGGIARFTTMFRLYRVPHPSGRNRWYNDPENRATAVEVLRAAFNPRRAE